jgi:hypothetical protein
MPEPMTDIVDDTTAETAVAPAAEPMREDEIASIVRRTLEQCIGYDGGPLSEARAKALRYYRGEPLGNEIEGRSQIVSRDVAEVVDGMIPDLLKPFVSGDETVRYEPRGPEDEQAAQQATDYANYVWNVDNPGFTVFHDWIKDGLLARVGVVKVWWEREQQTSRESYTGLTEVELAALQADPSVTKIVASSAQPIPGPDGQPVPSFDATVHRTVEGGCIRIRNVPPEEFLVLSERIQLDDRPFVAHRCRRTLSDLRELGYPEEKIARIDSGGAEYDVVPERDERESPEQELIGREEMSADPAQREVWVSECYLPLDADGDGIAEYRKVTLAGDTANVVLDNEEVDDHPFAAWSPYPIPHKFHGESVADKVMDVQLTKSAILRQMLDNLYLVNNARTEIVEGKVNLDDFMSSKPGGYIRVREAGAMREIAVPPVFQHAFPALEYLDTVRENRSGATRYNQGLDADSLNKTATGINAIMTKAQGRLETIARIFAEVGVKRAFRMLLKLMTRYQDRARVVRLRNTWIAVDPRAWNAEMDVAINVGLGTGNKDQQLAHLMAVWDKQLQAMQVQGGPDGPMVTLQHMYETARKIVENAGLKSAEQFFADPSQAPPPPPKPDPEMEKAKAQIEIDRQKAAADFELRKQKQDGELMLKQRELAIRAAQGAFMPQSPVMPAASA